MPNTYFSFKQFTIYQDQCAMKVCTDSCILGAWFTAKLPAYSATLDIGSGTGLLMLMLAQKTKGAIDGIELDLAAYKQLKENIGRSKWHDRMTVYPGDVRYWSCTEKYDFIITNPPFFEGDLAAATHEKNLARHSAALALEELVEAIDRNLKPNGGFGILLPYERTKYFETLAKAKGFMPVEILKIRQTPAHDFFRSIVYFSRASNSYAPEFELTIKNEDGNYSPEFAELMKDYYLNL